MLANRAAGLRNSQSWATILQPHVTRFAKKSQLKSTGLICFLFGSSDVTFTALVP